MKGFTIVVLLLSATASAQWNYYQQDQVAAIPNLNPIPSCAIPGPSDPSSDTISRYTQLLSSKYTTLSADPNVRTVVGPCDSRLPLTNGVSALSPFDLCTTYIPATPTLMTTQSIMCTVGSSAVTSCTPTTTLTLPYDLPSGVIPKCDVSVVKMCTPTTTITLPGPLPSSGISFACGISVVTAVNVSPSSSTTSNSMCTSSSSSISSSSSSTSLISSSSLTSSSSSSSSSIVASSSIASTSSSSTTSTSSSISTTTSTSSSTSKSSITSSLCTPTSTLTLPKALPQGITIPCGISVVVSASSSSAPVSSIAIRTFNFPAITTAIEPIVVPIIRVTSTQIAPIMTCLQLQPSKTAIKVHKAAKKDKKKIEKKKKSKRKGRDLSDSESDKEDDRAIRKRNRSHKNRKHGSGRNKRDRRREIDSDRDDFENYKRMNRRGGRADGFERNDRRQIQRFSDQPQGYLNQRNQYHDQPHEYLNQRNPQRSQSQGYLGQFNQPREQEQGYLNQGNRQRDRSPSNDHKRFGYNIPDGNGLEYMNQRPSQQHSIPNDLNRPNYPNRVKNGPTMNTTSVICPIMKPGAEIKRGSDSKTSIQRKEVNKKGMKNSKNNKKSKEKLDSKKDKKSETKNSKKSASRKGKKSASKNGKKIKSTSKPMKMDNAVKTSILISHKTVTSIATATEIIAFANFRTRTVSKIKTKPVTLTATQIDAYEIVKTEILSKTKFETDTVTATWTTVSTEMVPLSIFVTSIQSLTVPTVHMVTQDNFVTVTMKEPKFTTITFTPPAETQISISSTVQTVTETFTTTASPVDVYVSTTVIKF